MDRIALAVDAKGKLADFFSLFEILIYEKQFKWTVVDRFQIAKEGDRSSAVKVRNQAERIGNQILEKNCKYIVGREIIGIPYHTLIKAGLEVLEANEINNALLDAIYEDFLKEKGKTHEDNEMVPPRPVPIDDEGNYFMDFRKVIKSHPELSSKKMLLPFLSNNLFFSLLIRCEHIMPWLDDYVKCHGLKMETKRENGTYHVMIIHSSCNQ